METVESNFSGNQIQSASNERYAASTHPQPLNENVSLNSWMVFKPFDGKDLKSREYYHKRSVLVSGAWLFYEHAMLSPILPPWKVIMYLWGRLIFALCWHPINNNPNICTHGIFCDIMELTDPDYSGAALCTELPLVSKWVRSSEQLQSKTRDIYVYEIGETLSFADSVVTKPE